MSSESTGGADALAAFAAAVAHEIRTPLAAVAGEVELALRRDRPAAEYRDALQRIGDGIGELVEITSDLSLLAGDHRSGTTVLPTTTLDCVLAAVEQRYAHQDVTIDIDRANRTALVGEEARIARALARVLEHAVRHRRPTAPVFVRLGPAAVSVCLIIEAGDPGFWPPAWASLATATEEPSMPLRLRTARRILEANGGTLSIISQAGRDSVRVDLARA